MPPISKLEDKQDKNSIKEPKYQTMISSASRFLVGFIGIITVIVTILDFTNYSLTTVSTKWAAICTVLLIFAWIAIQLYLRKKGIVWKTEKRLIRIRGLGKQYYLFLIGAILALWIGPIINYIRSIPNYQRADDNTILVIITKFQLAENVPDSLAYQRIKDAIESEKKILNITNLRVEIDDKITLANDDFDKARALGEKSNATIVIWGSETRVDLVVNFYNLRVTKLKAAKMVINELYDPAKYSNLVVKDIPSRINFLSLLTIGDILSYKGQKEKAADVVNESIMEIKGVELSPQEEYAYAEAYFRLGTIYNDLQNYSEAITAYAEAITRYPNNPRAFNNRGTVKMRLQDDNGALADFDQAILLDPKYPLPYNNKGIILNNQGDYSAAIIEFDKAIALWQDYSNAYAMRGVAYEGLKKYDLALEDLSKSIKLTPWHAVAYHNRAVVYYDLEKYDLVLRKLN